MGSGGGRERLGMEVGPYVHIEAAAVELCQKLRLRSKPKPKIKAKTMCF